MREIDSYLVAMPCLRAIKLYFRTGLRTRELNTKDFGWTNSKAAPDALPSSL